MKSSTLTREQTILILDDIASKATTDTEVIAAAVRALRACRLNHRCMSPLCPDCIRRYDINPIRQDLTSAFSAMPVNSLRRIHFLVPGLVPGDFRFRRCLIQLREAIAEFTEPGTRFRACIRAFAGLVHRTWTSPTSESGSGFTMLVRLLCETVGEIDEVEFDHRWRTLLVKKWVSDLGPWATPKPLVVIHPVRSIAGAIDVVSRSKEPLPHNLAEIPAAAIIEAFGYPKALFRLYGQRTLRKGI
jgi:hypothetical protein